jgi:hypothetical protein
VGFIRAGSVGFVWLALRRIFFDHSERTRWLAAAERAKILSERDGALELHIAAQPASSLRCLLTLLITWGLFLT